MRINQIREGWKDWLKPKPAAAAPTRPIRKPGFVGDPELAKANEKQWDEIQNQKNQPQPQPKPQDPEKEKLRQEITSDQNNPDYIDPDKLWHQRDYNKVPFIYTKDGNLHTGESKDPHYRIVHRTPELQKLHDQEDEAAERHSLQLHTLVGRIGKINTSPTTAKRIVSFWNSPQELMELLKPCIQKLLDDRYIKPTTEIHHPKINTTHAAQIVGGAAQDRNDPELEKKADLARQLHLMTGPEKQAAMKQLGLHAGTQKTNPWVTNMRNAGLPAGTSHHFGTSESFERRLHHALHHGKRP